MTALYRLRPISDRTAFSGGPPASGERNPFEAPWSSTLKLLKRELDHLDAHDVVLEQDLREQDIRVDGTLRQTARPPATPATRLAFESTHGPLVYATDRFGWRYDGQPLVDGWQQNVRAIALGLEALRKVDRYGVSRRGEQYRGYKAIGAGDGTVASGMTTDLALEVIARESGVTPGLVDYLAIPAAVRTARANAHPDRNNGDRSRYDAVDQAVQVLTRAGRL